MVIKYYYSTITASVKMDKDQQRIDMILSSKKFEYVKIDISQREEDKNKMRELCKNEKALAPQLFNDDTYLGDYDKFDEAVENEELEEFLQIKKSSKKE